MREARLLLVRTRSGKTHGLRARFYVWSGESPPDPSLAEKSEAVREVIHPLIDFVWDDSPLDGVPAGNFMVEWTGYIDVPETGVYRIYVIVDDGVKVWVDEKLVIDAWMDQPPTQYVSEPLVLERGFHKVRILYYNNDVFGRMLLGWMTPEGYVGVIPPDRLYTKLSEYIEVKGLPPGYRVELRNGFLVKSGVSKFGIARIDVRDLDEPIPAYFRVYDTEGRIVLETPVISDVWGGDEYITLAK